MPLKRCTSDGKSGWKYGDSGHCYTGPGAKKKAIKQGLAVDGPEGFKTNATLFDEPVSLYDSADLYRDLDVSDGAFLSVAELAGYTDSEIRWALGLRAAHGETKVYEVKYEAEDGRTVTTSISAKTSSEARKFIKSQFPTAKIIDIYEA